MATTTLINQLKDILYKTLERRCIWHRIPSVDGECPVCGSDDLALYHPSVGVDFDVEPFVGNFLDESDIEQFDEDEMKKEYMQMLDETNDPINLNGIPYDYSYVWECVSPRDVEMDFDAYILEKQNQGELVYYNDTYYSGDDLEELLDQMEVEIEMKEITEISNEIKTDVQECQNIIGECKVELDKQVLSFEPNHPDIPNEFTPVQLQDKGDIDEKNN